MKTLFVAILAIATLTSKANYGNGEQPASVKLEVKAVSATKVQVITNLVVKADETFEIQKSYDNRNFTTVAVVLGTEETATMPVLKITDIVKPNANVYYRIVKIEGNTQTILSNTQSIK